MEDIGCYYFMTFFPAEIQLEDNSTFKVEINDLHNSETATCFYNSLAPKEFMLFCLNMEEKGYHFSICWYVKICLREKSGQSLTPKEVAIKNKCKKAYANIDLSAYQKIVDKRENETNIQTEEELKLVLKDSFLGVMDGVKKAYNLNNGKDYSAFLEFIKAHINNLDFIKEDKSHRKIQGYNSQKKKELYELIETFKCRTYPLNKVIIKLTPRYLMHIAVGHIKHYKIPRKGKQIQFIHIQDWKLLVAVIDHVIDLLKEDLNAHYNAGDKEYNNVDIEIINQKYGIHISKKGYIKTFYQLD